MLNDLELLRQIGRGDEHAFRALVDRESRYLYGVALALTGNTADAEDVVQETFAAVLTSKYRGASSVRTWLVGILVRRAGMLHRSRRRFASNRTMNAAVPAGETGSAGAEARLDLSTMLGTLSPEHRAVIVLRELQGLTYEEMAAVLGIPRGTVESRLHRAREELRHRYKAYFEETTR